LIPARQGDFELPAGEPRIIRILVAAAEDHVADKLREHASHGMDTVTAASLTAAAFADTTAQPPHTPPSAASAVADGPPDPQADATRTQARRTRDPDSKWFGRHEQ